MGAPPRALIYLVGERPWIEHAACRDLDPNIWFPGRAGSLRLARAICADCPVRRPCLDYALENHETLGVWGGTSERQRRTLFREHRDRRRNAA